MFHFPYPFLPRLTNNEGGVVKRDQLSSKRRNVNCHILKVKQLEYRVSGILATVIYLPYSRTVVRFKLDFKILITDIMQ